MDGALPSNSVSAFRQPPLGRLPPHDGFARSDRPRCKGAGQAAVAENLIWPRVMAGVRCRLMSSRHRVRQRGERGPGIRRRRKPAASRNPRHL